MFSALHRQQPLARVARRALWIVAPAMFALAAGTPWSRADHPGLAVYQEHCVRCHGTNGVGTPEVPEPLAGDRSANQLAAYIHASMPEDDPGTLAAEAARQVADYIHQTFYSAVARDRNRPAREELSRLTVRQYRNTVADLVAHFRGRGPAIDDRRGLRAEYFSTREFNRQTGLVLERIDEGVDFDFGVEGPDPERFAPSRFSIRWSGSIMPAETGLHEFVVRTDHAVRLVVNSGWYEPSLIDAMVKSGSETEYRASVMLLGGRSYPLRLEFSKANQGVDDRRHEYPRHASIQLLWKPPHGVLEPVPAHVLLPQDSPHVFVLRTPFPPDDRSIGYERGAGIAKEWFAAATAAAIETADYCLDHVEHLARAPRDAADRGEKLRQFAATFAERAFRRPLSPELRAAVVDGPFADAPDLDTGLKRSILAVLGSPRFLYPQVAEVAAADGFATASRLALGLWDSLADGPLWDAASRNQLATPEQVRPQAERMVDDRRTRAKVRDFLFAWLRIDGGPEIVKDPTRYSEFSPEIAAAMRTSLELFLDDVVWGDAGSGGTGGRSDYRRLFLEEDVYVDGRLGPFLGVSLPAGSVFRRVRLDDGRRAGVLSHPYLASVLSYSGGTSPIHRGVFLSRSVLGNVLKPPQEAVAPLAPDLHPTLTTRERVVLQTSAVACQTCHTMINPLGFSLEEFDAVGRHRTAEKRGDSERAIDASGSYQPREGPAVTFRGARELAAYLATSRDAREAFVQNLFHALVKQPARAWGPESLDRLETAFEAGGCNIRRLLVDIICMAAVPPPPAARPESSEKTP